MPDKQPHISDHDIINRVDTLKILKVIFAKKMISCSFHVTHVTKKMKIYTQIYVFT